MTNKNEFKIVSEQFLLMNDLVKDIEIINIITNYKATEYEVGINTEHFKYHNYKELFDNTLRNENYTMSLLDDSMIAMSYVFDDNGQIIKHNLSFLPNYKFDLYRDGMEFEYEEEDADISDELFAKRISNYIRIDYDVKGNQEYHHSLVHMHIGLFEYSIRLPFKHVVYPYEFLYLIFKYIYHLNDECLQKIDCQYEKDIKLTANELSKFKMVYAE